MEAVCTVVSVSLLILAVLTMVFIVRDVSPLLNLQDRSSVRSYWMNEDGWNRWRITDPALSLRNAWNLHSDSFPKSRKRTVFASLLIAFALSVMTYPVWLVFAAR
jgi:hypothetical protein